MVDPTPPAGGGGAADGPGPGPGLGDGGGRGLAVDAEHALTVEFEYATERRARTVADSIRVETDEVPDDRSRASVGCDGRVVAVDVVAADLVALRAGANTWLRLVGVAEDVASAAAERRAGVGSGPSRGDGG